MIEGRERFLVSNDLNPCPCRFCAPSSELQIAEVWYERTALDDLLESPVTRSTMTGSIVPSMPFSPVKTLYVNILQQRYGELFGSTFRLSLLRHHFYLF